MSQIERVNVEDDPRRCQGATRSGQCWNVASEGSNLCPMCSGRDMVEENRRGYILTNPRLQERLTQLSAPEEIKSLQQEVAMAKMLIEERYNLVKTDQDAISAHGAINSMLLTVEKLISRSHILEQNLGQLFHKSTVIQMIQDFIKIVDDEIRPLEGGIKAVDRIVQRLYAHANEVRNTEKVRSVKLLESE